MTLTDAQIGRNLRGVRERLAGSDPDDLALRMRLRGWRWDAATVDSIEDGARPLLRSEADDLVGVLGYSDGFLTAETDAEHEADITDQMVRRAEGHLRRATEWWQEVADRYRISGLTPPIDIDTVVAEAHRAHRDPDAALGVPLSDDRTTHLADWANRPERPLHPLDAVEAGAVWTDEQIAMQLDHDLREASDAVRYATVQLLRVSADG
ncbi:hypothetical protein KZI27_11300 [Curtobacterium sp. TC1]|uniref:hypothetical protein n=1 Tax=Curtobacterium sp. TC1 TaxID=2862880 RepID=UPI001C9B1198|nr:hypothetical protein [Curtobacterium sp. TC1]QZQ53945.1 hypothetical protein KZI27_11300 [Curtobacterium sp. TC1]